MIPSNPRADWLREPPRLEELERLLISTSAAIRAGSEDGPGALNMVMSARLTSSGDRIVVLDQSPPFLKMYSQTGTFLLAGIQRGTRPTELMGPGTVAVTDALVAIAGFDGLAIADLTANIVDKPKLPLQLLDVGFDCQRRLVAYGPSDTTPMRLVHTLRLEPVVSVVTSLAEDAAPPQLSWGHGRSAIIGGGAGSVVAHRSQHGVDLIFLGCDGKVHHRPWSWAVNEFPAQRAKPTLAERHTANVTSFLVDATAPLFLGAAELPGPRLLWVESRIVPSNQRAAADDAETRTYMHLADSEGVHRGFVAGWYALQDVGENAVVLSAAEPWPHVLVVPITSFTQLVDKGQWLVRQ